MSVQNREVAGALNGLVAIVLPAMSSRDEEGVYVGVPTGTPVFALPPVGVPSLIVRVCDVAFHASCDCAPLNVCVAPT
jgi:hypothetical protein